MIKAFFSFCCFALFITTAHSQVGIGTNAPHPKAALEIKATDKGVLFPMMTTAQRDDIDEPPNGLHVFNTDENCLNFYNSLFNLWVGYCDDVKKIVTIRISANAAAVDFYNTYAKNYPGTKNFIVIVQPGVTLTTGLINAGGGTLYFLALAFNTMPAGSSIKLINHGNILGSAGLGGNGPIVGNTISCTAIAKNGTGGGDAIGIVPGISIAVDNYGIIAGGGGGGGGGGTDTDSDYGGGGGGGAPMGAKGTGGGTATISCPIVPISCSCPLTEVAQAGNNGLLTIGGAGGAGASNGGKGGNGGNLAQPGQNGSGTGAGLGGLPGRAVVSTGGASGIIINNINGGQVFGVVQ